MAQLPFTPNATCDVVHNNNTQISGIQCFLAGSYERHTRVGEKDPMSFRFTHILLVPLNTDIRDEYGAGVQPGGQDTVWIPQHNAAGTPFTVRFIENKALGTAWAHLKVYLDRGTPPWPTRNL
jgi:hypothetical protein